MPRRSQPGTVGPPLPFAAVEQDPATARLRIFGPQLGTRTPSLLTQDRGEISPKGQVLVYGRADRLVISGGRNIDPSAVERTLLRHPAVAQALVFGLPDALLGEQLIAAIAPAQSDPVDARTADPPSLGSFAAAQLHRYDRPRRWALVRSLPTTAAGKISAATRDSVRARVLAALGLELKLKPQTPQMLKKVDRSLAGAEVRQINKRVLVLDLGVENIIGALDREDDADPGATTTPAQEADPSDRHPQAVPKTHRTAKVRLGVDHRHPPAGLLHPREPLLAESPAENILPGLVAPLEEAAKEGNTGAVDLRKADDVDVGLEHPGDLRPATALEQGVQATTPKTPKKTIAKPQGSADE
jgi:hypothetical protein